MKKDSMIYDISKEKFRTPLKQGFIEDGIDGFNDR